MNAPHPPRPRRWRRRLFWTAIVSLVVLGPPVAIFYYHRWAAYWDLQDAIAETDRIDPEWRLEQLEARRRKVPDESNSALVLISARQALPKNWRELLSSDFQNVP
ncbi:MAG: hypothetical protein L0228_14605, partial [Planctomycetes bacterium]|nr:hypothetical protein [Planctomycetota bacterium]